MSWHLRITSKAIVFSPLALVGSCLLGGSAAALYINARSCFWKITALLLALLPALAPALFNVTSRVVFNVFFATPKLGTGIYNYNAGLMPLSAAAFEALLFVITIETLVLLRRETITHNNTNNDTRFFVE